MAHSKEGECPDRVKIANLEEDSRANCTATKLPSYVQFCHPSEAHISSGLKSTTDMKRSEIEMQGTFERKDGECPDRIFCEAEKKLGGIECRLQC